MWYNNLLRQVYKLLKVGKNYPKANSLKALALAQNIFSWYLVKEIYVATTNSPSTSDKVAPVVKKITKDEAGLLRSVEKVPSK